MLADTGADPATSADGMTAGQLGLVARYHGAFAQVRAYQRGLVGPLNLGNVHAGPQRLAVSRSVFLTDIEKQQLIELTRDGLAVTIQAVPNEPALRLS